MEHDTLAGHPTESTASVDPRLINDDLAPARSRDWGFFSLFAMWMSDIHSIGGYTFAAGLFALGIGAVSVFASLTVGIIVVFLLMNLVGFAGQRTGLCYPVLARITFGTLGSNLPALLRGFVAICWYGIQTWLASRAVIVLVGGIWPGVTEVGQARFLGESLLGWAAFLFMWALQLLLLRNGMDTIRRFQDWAGPAVWVVMLVLTVYILMRADWHISLNLATSPARWGTAHAVGAAVALTVSYFSTLLLNFCDFSRFSPTRRAVWMANLWGLPVNFIAFSVVSVLVTAGSLRIYGDYIFDPIELVARIEHPVAIILGAVTFTVATLGINVVANFVSPAYDLANAWPERITFVRGGVISACIALVITPWNLYSNPVIINVFLAALGAVLGPLFGIIIADYYILRREKVQVSELFRADGLHSFTRGWNLRAVWAFVVASAPSVAVAVVPTDPCRFLSPFSWFIGAALGLGVHLLLSRHDPYVLRAVRQAESVDLEADRDSVSR
ncbi:NCS1 family nucleobase:cation symporter-1 [Actinomyces wuliandei]|uniref:NCS1 family nucleobase:cation symporter-1 n=1 Tax=Actinomyces wuliandei TaxID=2057743 RepID=UPI000FD92FEC|nr:NCS1 family nucleobase:cation symporter-1 [Actinomyces wuliandei]